MKRLITILACSIFLVSHVATAADFRFSPRPNKAHLVQWRSWSRETLEEARKKNRLVLLSLSAVWCHWCHVMDETTYSDEAVISFINDNFIPVRVDADMRPDIDTLYNQGGWPSTAILTPQGEVLYGGNYIPPEELLGRLKRIAAFGKDPAALAERIEEIKASKELSAIRQGGLVSAPNKSDLDHIVDVLKNAFDKTYGGFGGSQKFPNPDAIDFLLFRCAQSRDESACAMVVTTLDRMASGEIVDKVDGGFFRYATKPDWSEPHYEKLLEVNAGLIGNYAGAFRVLKKKEYLAEFQQTAHYIRNNLLDTKSGALYGSQDADGDYYRSQKRKGLKAPAVDKTTYGDSSSLLISALVAAYDATGEEQYLEMAAKSTAFIIGKLYSEHDGVHHYWRDGTAHLKGLLADNALFGSALLDVYNATGEKQYLIIAQKIGSLLLDRFYDPGAKQFRLSVEGDLAKPATAGMLTEINANLANYRALRFLGRLAYWGENARLKKVRDDVFATFSGEYARFSFQAAAYGNALLWVIGEPVEITIVTDDNKVDGLLAVVRKFSIPQKVVRVLSLMQDQEELKRMRYPLKKAVYLCAGKRCSAPIEKLETFESELRQFVVGNNSGG